jgi:hypothetical protein
MPAAANFYRKLLNEKHCLLQIDNMNIEKIIIKLLLDVYYC